MFGNGAASIAQKNLPGRGERMAAGSLEALACQRLSEKSCGIVITMSQICQKFVKGGGDGPGPWSQGAMFERPLADHIANDVCRFRRSHNCVVTML